MVSNAPSEVKPTPTTSFVVGERVKWKHLEGFVNFIDEHYITICVHQYDKNDPMALTQTEKVCVLCYPQDWKDVIHEDRK
jgi:hypothetical protein